MRHQVTRKLWNYIYVPTCDGSFHFGDAAADYDKDGVPDHFHNGLRQTSAAVSVMKELFPNSRKILIVGSSNGGYGTFGATPIVRLAFPKARLYVLNDSGPGLFRPEEPALWPVLIKTWNLSSMLPANCQQCQNEKAGFLSLLVGFPADTNMVKLLVKLSTAQIRQAFGKKHQVVIVGPTTPSRELRRPSRDCSMNFLL